MLPDIDRAPPGVGRSAGLPKAELVSQSDHWARRNAAMFFAVLILQDVLLLTLRRVALDDNWTFYRVSQFRIENYLLYTSLAAALCILTAILCYRSTIYPKLKIHPNLIKAFFVSAILANVLSFSFIEENARYVSGGLVGISGIIYALSLTLNLSAMLLLVKFRISKEQRFSLIWSMALAASFALNIDGLASAMTISAFMFLVLADEIRLKNILPMFVAAFGTGAAVFWGFSQKFREIPSYVTPEFLIKWVISRFAISAEQGYTFISGDSVLNRPGEYFALISRAFVDRASIIVGERPVIVFPRSVAEALYYDMYGQYDAGSSPGFFLGVILNGLIALPIIYLYCLVTVQMFSGFGKRMGLISLFAIGFIAKSVYANVSELIVLISPVTPVVILFIFICFVGIRESVQKKDHNIVVEASSHVDR